MKLNGRLLFTIVGLVVAGGAGVGGYGCYAPRAPVEIAISPPAAGRQELALLAPLVPGATLDGWKVVEIGAVQHGRIDVLFEQDGEKIELQIARKGGTAQPPASSGPYAVYYSLRRSAVLHDGNGVELAHALADVLDHNEGAPPLALALAPYGDDAN